MDNTSSGRQKSDAVAVIGVGHSRIGGPRTELSLQELIFEGATAVLADAGITRDDVDSVVLSASDLIDGRGIANMASAPAAGAYMKHETRTTNDGLFALVLGAIEILAGRTRIALVISWNKMSEVDWQGAAPTAAEPFFERPVGLNDTIGLGLAAASSLANNPDARALATRALLRNRANAADNRRAKVRERLTMSDVNESLVACWPIREADLPPETDGVYGVVLATEEIARRSGRGYALLRGFAWGSGRRIGDRATVTDTGLADVAARAYRSAGLTRLDEIDVIELVARSSFEEVAILEGLIAPLDGNAHELLRSDATGRRGALPVNPSGGCSGTYLMQAAGLTAAGEVVRQLTGRAEAVQIPNARLGIAHGQSGHAAQANVVAVFAAAGSGER